MPIENLKKVFWVFNRLNFSVIPSYYASGILPSNYLKSSKLVFLEGHDPEKTLDNIDCEVLILLKAFDNGLLNLAECAKKRGIKIISVFDDWYFENKERTELNIPLANLSDHIIVKTTAAETEIEKYFKIKTTVIPDPVRFYKNEIFNINNNNKLNLCWFGTHSNHDTIINEINKLNKNFLEINITILTNYIHELKKEINLLDTTNLNITIKEWNENSDKDIVQNEIIILPYPSDKRRLVKSSNRIVDSLNLGRFTILSPVPQFKKFKDFVYYGNILEGILWFKENQLLAKEKTILGQQYVDKNYSLDVVSQKWRDLF